MIITFQANQAHRLFFTSDLHLNHGKPTGTRGIIDLCKRPFSCLNEMHEALISNWNKKVPADGVTIVAGDLGWKSSEKLIKRLNGEIILVFGNHDKYLRKEKYLYLFKETCDLLDLIIKPGGIHIVICHYCMRTWNKSHYNSHHLYGHSHNTLPPIGKSWDIGVDGNNFTPLSFKEIEKIMEKRPDNPNLIKRS